MTAMCQECGEFTRIPGRRLCGMCLGPEICDLTWVEADEEQLDRVEDRYLNHLIGERDLNAP